MRWWRLALAWVLLEAGWLALWPLSIALTHSPLFTSAALARLPREVGIRPVTEPLGDPAYIAPTAALVAVFALLGGSYLFGLRALGRGGRSSRTAWWIVGLGALAFQTTLLLMPGFFSQDVFSYIAYGRLTVAYELNPYIWPPAAIARDPVVEWVADVWRTYPAPYGPVWLDVQWLMARLFDGLSIPAQAMAYRALGNVLLLCNLGLAGLGLGRLTPLDRAQRLTAFAALAWNPVLLFEVAGNAHNDALMVTFSLLALVLLTRPGRLLSTTIEVNRGPRSGLAGGAPARFGAATAAAVAFTLGALVKYLSGIGVVWLTLAELVRVGSVKAAFGRLMLVLGVAIAIAWPWLELPDSLDPLLNETAGAGSVNELPATLVQHALSAFGTPPLVAHGAERLLVVLGFGVYLLLEAGRVIRLPTAAGVARATARSVLIYVLLVSTSVQTWYFCLPIAAALLLGWNSRLTHVAVAYGVLALPTLYAHYYLRDAAPVWLDLVYVCAPLAWLAVDTLRARARADKPAAVAIGDDDHRADGHRLAGTVVKQSGG